MSQEENSTHKVNTCTNHESNTAASTPSPLGHVPISGPCDTTTEHFFERDIPVVPTFYPEEDEMNDLLG